MKALDVIPEPLDDWDREAQCQQAPPGYFYPAPGPDDDIAAWEEARRVATPAERDAGPWRSFCDICPVRTDCLAHAYLRRENSGIWGGMDEVARARLLRRLRRGTVTWDVIATGALFTAWEPESVVLTG